MNNKNKQPNILILLSDQLRRQALACYGDPDSRTPNIDQLANTGVRFNNACSTYPVCVPFRFTLMTGEFAHTRQIPAIEWSMSPAERTLADEFNDAGYQTINIGKWHLDGGHGRTGSARQIGLTPVKPVNQGRWRKWLGFDLRNDPFDTYYFEDADPTPKKLEGYQTDGLFKLGMDYLVNEYDDTQPFCMVISVEPPHSPFVAPDDLQTAWEARDISLPNNFAAIDPEQREDFIMYRKRYYAMVENLDQNVGKMREFLQQQGLADNTIILFFSDHGEFNGSHGLMGKQWPYEESVGIPLLIFDPTTEAASGRIINDPVATEDLFPTILGLAGLSPKNELPGLDLAPMIRNERQSLERDGVMLEFVAEHRQNLPFHDAEWRAYRTENFKYNVKGNKLGANPWQFFDLKNDPGEMNNLIDEPDYQAEITRHHRLLAQAIKDTDDHFVLLPAYGCKGVNTWDIDEPI
jgi:arylsulfatase A-like enzyme